MVALSASRLVWSATPLISSMTEAMSTELRPRRAMISVVRSATSTAWVATRAASHALAEICVMLAVSSSAAEAALCTFCVTMSDCWATIEAWLDVVSATSAMTLLVAVSCSAAAASICALSPIADSLWRCAAVDWLSVCATRPSSSSASTSAVTVRSPFEIELRVSSIASSGPVIDRMIRMTTRVESARPMATMMARITNTRCMLDWDDSSAAWTAAASCVLRAV